MYRDREVAVIIASGGKGSRLGAEVPKQFLKLEDRPILIKTVSTFAAVEEVDYILIVSSKEQRESTIELLEAELTDGEMEKVSVAEGGKTRQKSVFCGLKDLRRTRLDESATVLIHDAARPFVSEELICKVMEATAVREYAIPCTPLKDTIRTKKKTLDRSTMLAVQTPQGFIFHDIYSAHEKAEIKGITATDDAGLMEEVNASSGKTVTPKIVEGEDGNIKITTMEDFKIAAHLEKEKRRELSNNHISEDRGPIRGKEEYQSRIGQGYDVHRLVEGRRLILGGIEIPNEKGLLGHSDADVLTHAIMDAALGAAGLGDIGGMFPDSDGAYKGADSMELLRNVNEAINRRGYVVSNIDATIVAQKPKMAPYIEAMRAYIARILDVERDAVNIKATTTEKLGFEGQELAISAQAVCMLKSFNKER